MSKSKVNSVVPDEDWQVYEDMRTLVRAEEIKRDPKRLAAARKRAKEEQGNLTKTIETTAAVAATK